MSPPDGTNVDGAGAAGADGGAAGAGGGTDNRGAGAAAGGGAQAGAGQAGNGAAAGSAGGAGTGAGAAAGAAGAGAGGAAQQAAPWGDDWRQRMGRNDEKTLSLLGRYQSPEAVVDALRAANVKIDSGQLRSKLPDNPTAEQVAEYRKDNGIPETHDKYDLTLPDGLVIGEADKPLVDSFLKSMHDQHATPGEVKRAMTWYYKQQDAQREATEETDAQFKNDNIAALGKEWGGDYKRNVAIVDNFLAGLDPKVKDAFMGARLPNGRLAAADPGIIKFLLDQAVFRNPIPSSIGGSSDTHVKGAEARLTELNKLMGDRKSAYWKGPEAAKMQQEFRDLTTGLQQLRERSGQR